MTEKKIERPLEVIDRPVSGEDHDREVEFRFKVDEETHYALRQAYHVLEEEEKVDFDDPRTFQREAFANLGQAIGAAICSHFYPEEYGEVPRFNEPVDD